MSNERLVELIEQCVIDNDMPSSEQLADYLIANEVIVPPCKVGDKLYYIAYRSNDGKTEKYIKEETIEMISIDSRSIYAHIPRALLIDFADLGKTVFLTREEVEKALEDKKYER